MLTELVVEDLGPIERAEMALHGGSSALTGETGAGKTLVVAALSLLLGDRADKQMIREGANEARVEGRFVVSAAAPAAAILAERGLVGEDQIASEVEIVIARSVSPAGSKARVNGRLAPISLLAEVGPLLVEIAGQHEHQRLTGRRHQRDLLDAFIGDAAIELAGRVRDRVRAAAEARKELEAAVSGQRDRARELDVLRFEIDEIEGAGVSPGEIEGLTTEAARLEHAEAMAAAVAAASDSLTGEGGAHDLVTRALGALAAVDLDAAGIDDVARRLEACSYELQDAAQELSGRVRDPDPVALEAIRDRLGALGKLRRKYGDDESEILDYLDRARARADQLAAVDAGIDSARRLAAELTEAAQDDARRLSELRRGAAPRLARSVETLLAELALPGARFEVSLAAEELHEGGIESVEFLVATGAGESPRPLAKIASGGELSRIGLALHRLVDRGLATTLVFDEVDAGVGGEAAQAVGKALARLAHDAHAQVLVVTHLPQVAAFADAQYRVVRTDGARRGVAVDRVDGAERVAELSRMLAGLPKSERAREHAQELLDLAAAGMSS